MMKMKSLLGMALAVLFLAVGMWQAQPVAAYDSVQGTVLDGNGDAWELGFKVTVVYGNPQLTIIEQVVSAPDNTFDINLSPLPGAGADITVLIDFNHGEDGTDRLRFDFQQDDPVTTDNPFTDWSGSYTSGYDGPIDVNDWGDGQILTGTGPTSVALVGLGANQVGPTAVYALIMLLLVISTAAFVVVRRRSQYSA